MVRGIHSAAAGMVAQTTGQEITANNLANANTPGYKRDVAGFGSVLSHAMEAASGRLDAFGSADMSPGALQDTGDGFNFALVGDGFFAVQTAGGTAYTRDGSFTRDAEGYLTTRSGDRVLGDGGPIQLSGAGWKVDAAGKITQDGREAGALSIVRFARGGLEKSGANLWTSATQPEPAVGVSVRQGYLEGSNVNTVREMVSMIAGFRTYEASQKSIQAQDQTLERLVNEVGRVG